MLTFREEAAVAGRQGANGLGRGVEVFDYRDGSDQPGIWTIVGHERFFGEDFLVCCPSDHPNGPRHSIPARFARIARAL